MLVFFNQVLGGVDILSGGEKITVELLRRWSKFMEIVVIISRQGLDLIKTRESLNVKYITLPITFLDKQRLYWRYTFFIPIIWFVHTIRSCAIIFNIHIDDAKIFSSGDFFCNIIPAFLLKIKNQEIKWVVSIFHIIDSPFKRKSGYSFLSNFASFMFQRFSLCFIRKMADKVLLLNEDVKTRLISQGFDATKLYVMGVGVDLGSIDAVINRGIFNYDACFMARLSPTKGISDIPKIWSDVVKEKNDSKLVIIGSGTEKEERQLRCLISKYNMDKQINMVGLKIGDDKYNLMKSSKIFIFPSYEEGFAISILEAMACKIPVIAWDLPAYKAIYRDTIITVPKGNIAMFAKEILNLLSNERLRIEYAEKAYNFAMQHDWNIVAKNAYERINN